MKTRILIVLLAIIFTGNIFAQKKLNFNFNISFMRADSEAKEKLRKFKEKFAEVLNTYDFELPKDIDFEKVESSIYITIKKEIGVNNYRASINISSGLVYSGVYKLHYKRDIMFSEPEFDFFADFSRNPDLQDNDIMSLAAIVKFYVYLILGENYDRLSFTDSENFFLQGNRFYEYNYQVDSKLSAEGREAWKKRLALLDDYRRSKNKNQRKLNALIFNSKYFFNRDKKDRAALFIPFIYEKLQELTDEESEEIFKKYHYELAEIFSLDKDSKYLLFLSKNDKTHKGYYDRYIKQHKLDHEK